MESAAAVAHSSVPVLWVDDEPEFLENIKKALNQENTIDLTVVESANEAEKELATGKYAAIVADFKLEKSGDNGARLLAEIYSRRKFFPIFAFTGYSDEPMYVKYLEKVSSVTLENKPASFNSYPLSQYDFFRLIQQSAESYWRVKDFTPEKIRFRDYQSNPQKYAKQVEAHWQKHNHWIMSELEKHNFLWGVVCGQEVVEGSEDMFDFPSNEELTEIGEAKNLIPFPYSVPILPETTQPLAPTNWSPTIYNADFYPTVCIEINGQKIEGDFDTGAYQSMISDELIREVFLDWKHELPASHLNQKYFYQPSSVQVSIIDGRGSQAFRKISMAVVKNWETTSFAEVNKSRKALLGRDLLRAFDVKITLDSATHTTYIELTKKQED